MHHILLTGGCGYVGEPLTVALLDEGYEITVIDTQWFGCRLKPHQRLRIIKQDFREISGSLLKDAQTILHLANIANDPSVELDQLLAWEVNVLGTMQLADKAMRAGVRQFIYASSGSVYGVKEESQVTEDLTLVPISAYNKTKMTAERIVLSYGKEMIVQCIRPATICGVSPRTRLDLSVNMLTFQALSRKLITVFGGNQMRPNVSLKDMIRIYSHFLKLGDKYSGCFNAGFQNMSILEIAELINKFVPCEIKISESNDPRSYRLNSDKLLATGFEPKYTVEDAILEIIEAYNSAQILETDQNYNVRWMKKLLS